MGEEGLSRDVNYSGTEAGETLITQEQRQERRAVCSGDGRRPQCSGPKTGCQPLLSPWLCVPRAHHLRPAGWGCPHGSDEEKRGPGAARGALAGLGPAAPGKGRKERTGEVRGWEAPGGEAGLWGVGRVGSSPGCTCRGSHQLAAKSAGIRQLVCLRLKLAPPPDLHPTQTPRHAEQCRLRLVSLSKYIRRFLFLSEEHAL